MRWRPALGAGAILLAACGSGSTESTASESPRTTGRAETTGTTGPSPMTGGTRPDGPGRAVPEFLDFTAETVRGEPVAGADYAGQDLVLWFWAPW